MPLLKLENVDLAFGEHIIFDQIHLQLEKGERIGLIGRNGEGKSTLLKTILGEQDVDGGNVYRHPNIRIAQVSQALPPSSDVSVKDFVASGEQAITAMLNEYESIAQNPNPESLGRMEQLQHDIDLVDGWSLHHRLARTLETFELDKGQMLAELSGGWRRKAAIARALVSDPDILLLDEPTNHLDIGLISWLEDFIRNFRGAVIIITHDRAFLRSVSNRIAELDRGALTVWQGGYPDFLVFKQQQLDTEEKHNALFDKRLAQEEAWIREGIKARRTRNEGRVRALKKMRDERLQRRTQKQLGKIDIAKDSRSGKLVAELDGVTFGFDHETVIQDFSCTILRGDKIGLIGPNGVGKSTFLKLVLNDLTPVAGTIRTGTQINVAYFDQTLEQIDLDANVIDNVAEGRQSVDINGKEKHVLSYLQDFMFSPKRARTPVKALSGGERSRVLLAKLFSKPSNLLVMDEPTNDLDTDTLELLESLLVQYQGTVLLVSHDREFLDNVITSSIVFEGQGVLAEYVGGYQDWLSQGGSWEKIVSASADVADDGGENPAEGQIEKKTKAKKISYKLQRELDDLPANIEKQESRVEELSAVTLKPDFYQGDSASIKDALQLLTDAQEKLDLMYARWEELAEMTEKD